MGYDLSGVTALITGASRGLGRALALAFGRAGARLAICARGADALEDVAGELTAAGVAVVAEAADVSDPAAMAALVERTRSRLGDVGVLVNNASLLGERVPLRDYPLDLWRRVLEVNITGALVASRCVLPGMRRAGGGSIINVTSGVGNRPRADWGAYAVSKWAAEALTYNLALEESGSGIRVNAVDPGSMRTAMRRGAYPDEDPLSLPTPEAVTDIFLWLASDAATGTTGQRFRAQEWTAHETARPPSRHGE